jgi:hypothetical protein
MRRAYDIQISVVKYAYVISTQPEGILGMEVYIRMLVPVLGGDEDPTSCSDRPNPREKVVNIPTRAGLE